MFSTYFLKNVVTSFLIDNPVVYTLEIFTGSYLWVRNSVSACKYMDIGHKVQ